jgi:hypothetical protein
VALSPEGIKIWSIKEYDRKEDIIISLFKYAICKDKRTLGNWKQPVYKN